MAPCSKGEDVRTTVAMTRDYADRVRVAHLLLAALAVLLVQSAMTLTYPPVARWIAAVGDPATLIVIGGLVLWIARQRGLAGPSVEEMPGTLLWVDRHCCVRVFNRAAADTLPGLHHGENLCERLSSEGAQVLREQVGSTAAGCPEFETISAGRRFRIHVGSRFGKTSWRFIRITDITEFRAMSERILLNEERYRSLFMEHPDAAYSLDVAGRVLEINPRMAAVTGCQPRQLLGCHWSKLFVPQDAEEIARQMEAVLSGDPRSYTSRVLSRCGEPTDVEVTNIPMFVGGEVVGVFGVAHDIAGRTGAESRVSASEERFRSLFDATGDGLILLDSTGNVRAHNLASRRMLNLKQSNDRLRLQDWLPDDVVGAARQLAVEVGGRRRHFNEVTLHRVTQPPVILEVEIGALGHAVDSGAYVLLRDVTGQRRYEERLQESQEELRRLNNATERIREEERSRIARDLHDDLGQTLTGIKMDLGRILAESASLPASTTARFSAMQEPVDNAIEQVREIAAKLRPDILDDLGFEAAAEWFLKRCEARYALDISLQLAPGVNGTPQGEAATALYRILQECMTNIARHAQASRVVVKYDEQDGFVVLEVEDDGRGFELQGSRHPGLGILGMKERAALLGGSVLLDSAPGRGTRVIVHMPLPDC